MNGKILLTEGQATEQIYASCCVRSLDVMLMPAVMNGCTHRFIANGSIGEPAVSKGSNDISSCSSDSPPVCNGDNRSVAVSKKRREQCLGPNLSDEQVLVLVAQHTKWNPLLLCFLSCVCKKTSAISNRVLWREFCLNRMPKMVPNLLLGAKDGRIDGGWQALGKLFLYCPGCCHSNKSSHFSVPTIAGHFVPRTRFSCTAGRSFLLPRCRMADVLYMSDPCEHANNPEDVGVFRGVFRGFDKSATKKLITSMRVPQEEEEKCPFCQAGVWSMGRARMIPRSAITRLAAFNDNVEYFICLNGHVNGRCALLHLSDTDTDADE